MEEDERKAINDEIKGLEQEFGYWCKIFAGRVQEKKYVLEGIQYLRKLRVKKQIDLDGKLKEEEHLRKVLPGAVHRLRGSKAAVEVSMDLNISLTNDEGVESWAMGGAESASSLMTPAQTITENIVASSSY